MNMDNRELADEGVMKPDYTPPEIHEIKVALTPLDEIGFPIERRGYVARVPHDLAEKERVARGIGRAAEKTARFIMGLPIGDEN